MNYLPSRFFSAAPEREPLGLVPIWTLERRLSALRVQADLTIIRVDRFSAALFFRGRYLAVPAWLDAVLQVPAELALARASSDLKEDMRRVRRGDFELMVSSQATDFEFFYQALYVPSMLQRHGALAFVRDAFWLHRRLRHGAILWAGRAGRPLAGMLVERRKQILYAWVSGVLNGNFEIVKQGAKAALYYQAINFARRQGCSSIHLGAVRPSLNDGLLRYKRKWGSSLTDNPHNHYYFLIEWSQWNPAIADFFSENPLVYRNNGNGLSAITAIVCSQPRTEVDASRTRHLLWTDGLDHLTLISTSGWEPGARPPSRTSLLASPYSAADGSIGMITGWH